MVIVGGMRRIRQREKTRDEANGEIFIFSPPLIMKKWFHERKSGGEWRNQQVSWF